MNAGRDGHAAPVADSSYRGASLGAGTRAAEAAVRRRLEASRALIRATMEVHLRESAPPQDAQRGAPGSLGQRLLEGGEDCPSSARP